MGHIEQKLLIPKETVARKNFVITIDGPTATGKQALAERLADKYNLTFLNTGVAIRGLALASVEQGLVTIGDDVHIPEDFAEKIKALYDNIVEKPRYVKDSQGSRTARCFMGNRDMGKALADYNNQKNIETIASAIAQIAPVREKLYKVWRTAKSELGGVVVVGRKTGLDLFPDAQFKVYLYADPEVSAMYRLHLRISATTNGHEEKHYVAKRDANDSAGGLLEKSLDAMVVNTSPYLNAAQGMDTLAGMVSSAVDARYRLT